MRKETGSIAFACALGAFVGALSALEIQSRFVLGSYLWIFGAFLGGLTAWCVVDFKQLCTGVARSYREVINWRPNWIYWKAFVTCFGGMISICLSALVVAFSLFILPTQSGQSMSQVDMIFIAKVLTTVCVVSSLYMTLLAVRLGGDVRRLENAREFGWVSMREFNPVNLAYWVLYGIWFVIRRLPKIVIVALPVIYTVTVAVKMIVITTFVYVHSERRTLCFVDATLGAIAGFFWGSAIVGAVLGAIFGVVNYEIVSVRWLELVPNGAK